MENEAELATDEQIDIVITYVKQSIKMMKSAIIDKIVANKA